MTRAKRVPANGNAFPATPMADLISSSPSWMIPNDTSLTVRSFAAIPAALAKISLFSWQPSTSVLIEWRATIS